MPIADVSEGAEAGIQRRSAVGLLLFNADLRLVHHTPEAAAILDYPRQPGAAVSLDKVMPAIRYQLSTPKAPAPRAPLEFMSGRRRYHCRAFLLDATRPLSPDGGRAPQIVTLLERVLPSRDLSDWFEAFQLTTWCDEFQLTLRESEMVKLLLKGMTSREIAEHMHISPATVKSYVRMVMTKVGASTRTGIVAKMLQENPKPALGVLAAVVTNVAQDIVAACWSVTSLC